MKKRDKPLRKVYAWEAILMPAGTVCKIESDEKGKKIITDMSFIIPCAAYQARFFGL